MREKCRNKIIVEDDDLETTVLQNKAAAQL